MSTRTPERAYRGVPREARRRDRHDRLLQAGCQVFARRGYAAAKIDEIVSLARVSRNSFYEFFENKEACLSAVCLLGVQRLRAALLEAVALELPPLERVKAEVRALASAYADDPQMARVMLIESVGATPAIEKARAQARLAFAQVIEAQLEEYPVWQGRSEHERRIVAMATMAAIEEPLSHLVATGQLDRWEEVVDPVSDFVIRAIVLSPELRAQAS
jgi:AcrR family transcriptional regulator